MKVSIETIVNTSLSTVWNAWVTPSDIMQWNFAIDEWCCPKAEVDLSVNGQFNYRMEAKDGSIGFDFKGEFSQIIDKELIEYTLEDNRKVVITFSETPEGINVVETFAAEDENTAEQQRQGWQGILNNFKRYAENKGD